MNNRIKKLIATSILFTLVAGCKLNITSSSLSQSSTIVESSSKTSTSKVSISNSSSSSNSNIKDSNDNSSPIVVDESQVFKVNGRYLESKDLELKNATATFENGLNIQPVNSNEKNVLILKHISLSMNKTYKVKFTAKGNANINLSLLNKGKEDVVKGMNYSYTLNNDNQNYEFVFNCEKDYSNVYIIIESDNAYTLSSFILERYNLYGDYEAPVFTGVENAGLYYTGTFDYALNVKVVDNVDGDLTSSYKVTLPKNVTVSGSVVSFPGVGEYKFIYTCSDKEGNEARVERIVDVYDSMPSGHEFIKNGSFDYGLSYWYHDAYNGAEGSFDVVKENNNNVLKASVTTLPAAGSHQPFPRLLYGKLGTSKETDELVIEKGCSYTFSFKMKASVARTIQITIGEILDKQDADGKWTYYFAQEPETGGWGLKERSITTEWQTFTIRFDMALNYTNENGCIAFLFGDSSNAQVGDIYLDDVSLVKN